MNSYSIKRKSLRYESERCSTFINWPFGTLGKTLAYNGFYRRCPDDIVCYFCGVHINVEVFASLIVNGHGYMNMKNIHYISCPFIKGNAYMNVTREQERLIWDMLSYYCPRYTKRAKTVYVIPKERFLSFINFPNKDCNIYQMVQSGFYYTGEIYIYM